MTAVVRHALQHMAVPVQNPQAPAREQVGDGCAGAQVAQVHATEDHAAVDAGIPRHAHRQDQRGQIGHPADDETAQGDLGLLDGLAEIGPVAEIDAMRDRIGQPRADLVAVRIGHAQVQITRQACQQGRQVPTAFAPARLAQDGGIRQCVEHVARVVDQRPVVGRRHADQAFGGTVAAGHQPPVLVPDVVAQAAQDRHDDHQDSQEQARLKAVE